MSTPITPFKIQAGICKTTYKPKIENQNKLKIFLKKIK